MKHLLVKYSGHSDAEHYAENHNLTDYDIENLQGRIAGLFEGEKGDYVKTKQALFKIVDLNIAPNSKLVECKDALILNSTLWLEDPNSIKSLDNDTFTSLLRVYKKSNSKYYNLLLILRYSKKKTEHSFALRMGFRRISHHTYDHALAKFNTMAKKYQTRTAA
ncbi:hypothetical protein LRP52_29170 [Photobacterium sp. ZSDE20]|uniref:Uncharacterized protein n=1 Tax=Photobacterium pectinilyticum TaxID=2906793 RepID=A0ABT1N3C1_9GAMM|nr:hypothetical protein [Photobacterium sp. ZSDE20]MCQ1058349.1 hypothetical protein [Photobacterium sp. ZSDE20]MDD1826251.1 hypothetical protein [Photobacterium sp. ZSDE20]